MTTPEKIDDGMPDSPLPDEQPEYDDCATPQDLLRMPSEDL